MQLRHNGSMKKRPFTSRKGPAHSQATPGSRPRKPFKSSPENDSEAKTSPQRRPFRGMGSTSKAGKFPPRFNREGAPTESASPRPARKPFRRDEDASAPTRSFRDDGRKPTRRTDSPYAGAKPRARFSEDAAPRKPFHRDEDTSAPTRSFRDGGRKPTRRSDSPYAGAKPRSRFSEDAAPRKSFRDDRAPRRRFPDEAPPAPRVSVPPVHKPAAPSLPEIRQPYLYGIHAATAAWRNPRRTCRRILITDNALPSLRIALQDAEQANIARPEIEIVTKEILDALLPKGSVHQGILLEVEPLPEIDIPTLCSKLDAETDATVMVLDQVTDPHNIGAILRSCAVFGAKALIVSRHNAPEISALIAKTATGAAEHVPVIRVSNITRALEDLAEGGFWRVGLDEHADKPLSGIPLAGKIAIVMGSEGNGMRKLTRENCDHIALLPSSGPLLSLNVSNAAAIALYEVQRQK